MKVYQYNEPVFDDFDGSVVCNSVKEITEEQILEQYFDYWSKKLEQVGKEHLISKENCIEDWVTVNWAWKKKRVIKVNDKVTITIDPFKGETGIVHKEFETKVKGWSFGVVLDSKEKWNHHDVMLFHSDEMELEDKNEAGPP